MQKTSQHPSIKSRDNRRSEVEKMESVSKKLGIPSSQEIFFVPRDYSQCNNPNVTQFSLALPVGLDNWIDGAEFDVTVSTINAYLAKAEKIDCKSYFSSLWNFLTCYIFGFFRKTRLEKTLQTTIDEFIREQNRSVYHPKGFHLVNPKYNGLRHLEFRSITYEIMDKIIKSEEYIGENK